MNILTAGTVRPGRTLLLLTGPLLSWAGLNWLMAGSPAGELELVSLVLVLVWSPLYFSLPAVLMQHERDQLLPSAGGPAASFARGVKLIPALLTGEIRHEFLASIVGWVALMLLTAPSLLRAVSSLIG